MRKWTRAALGRGALRATAAVLLIGAFPDAAHACPVCFDRDDEARLAFLATTGLLTLLPLGLVAGTGWWLRKRAREVEDGAREQEAHTQLDDA